MPAASSKSNRGPAAAAQNRAALIEAARGLFAERGYEVPLSAIARAAGVGQGVLYRHFPTRADLVVAVFTDNIAELRRLAETHPEPGGFFVVWRQLMAFTRASTAFVDAFTRSDLPIAWRGDIDMVAILAEPLERAQRAGLIGGRLRAHDLILLTRAAHGIASTPAPDVDVDAEIERLLWLADPALTTSPAAR